MFSVLHFVFEWVTRKWRAKLEHEGACIDFGDGMWPLLDLRFADDI